MKSSNFYIFESIKFSFISIIMSICFLVLFASTGQSTTSSITLTWTATGDDGFLGTATTYDIRYSTSIITVSNWNTATQVTGEPIPQSAGAVETFDIVSLEPSTTYYFAIKSADEAFNWSALSNIITKSTTDVTPPSAIIDLAATTGTGNGTISLNWTAPGDDNMQGTVAVYEIRYSQNEITDTNWLETSLFMTPPTPLPSTEHQSITLTGLTPGQQYYTAIKSYDSSGNNSQISNISSAEAGFNIATDIDDDINNNLPKEFALSQNYPNPFNPSTTIGFSLPTSTFVNLSIYNIEGEKVKTLVENNLSAGQHNIEWNGTNNNGSQIATGVYIYRIEAGLFSETKKMVLLK